MTKVFVVHWEYFDETESCGVFSTLEKAREYIKRLKNSMNADYTIEEWELDGEFIETRSINADS